MSVAADIMRIVVDVEKRATVAVEARLTLCPHLVSYIDTNDRTPLTDDHDAPPKER